MTTDVRNSLETLIYRQLQPERTSFTPAVAITA
jgi:hypothetical protein